MKFNKFLTAALILAGSIIIVSCGKDGGPIKGEGPIVQQHYTLPAVSAIGLSVDANVYLTHGEPQEIMIEGQQNIIDNIEKYVDADGFWQIRYDRNVRSHDGISIYITSQKIDYVHLSGSGSVSCQNIFPDTLNVDLNISGSGNISMMLNANVLKSTISGSGEIFLTGSAFEHQIHISGSGNVKAFGLPTYNTFVNISGSGDSEVNVENLLDVHISGSGNVYYRGNPTINSDISGSGEIHNSN
jgi:hypothetical protein